MKKSISVVSVMIVATVAIFICILQYLESRSVDKVEKEGFTELLYSRVRPPARSARIFYEDAMGNVIKHVDRLMYNLGKR